MKQLLTPARVRSVIADAMTEKDIENALRAHRICYSYDTSAGYLAIRVPARSGSVRIYRAASRSAPFLVQHVPVRSAPVLRFDW